MQRSLTLLASALIEFHSRDFRLYGILPSEAMASLRRALSIQNIPNGSPFAVPSGTGYGSASVSPSMSPTGLNSPTASASPAEAYYNKVAALSPSFFSWLRTFSWFRTVKLGGPEKSKSKGSSFRKSVSLVFLCFFVGLVFGLTPLSWYHARREFFLESFNNPDLDMPGEPHFTTGDETRIHDKSSHRHRGASKWSLGSTTGVRKEWTVPLKPLIIVTPTYNRPLQAYYMTRLAHTLKLVPPPLLWIVVEEYCQSADTIQLLRTTGLMYRHISCNATTTDIKDRGISQRNAALAHIEQHQLDGIVYFADDDNVYTMELFEQLREVKRFGTWPVAFLVPGKAKAVLEGPVCKEHEVIGWHTNEKSKRLRRFHVDMAGFAFNSTVLWDPQRWGRWIRDPIRQLDTVKEGFQETTFIEQLVEDESQMEGLPSGCSKVMVWHLHFETPGLPYPSGWVLKDHLPSVISAYDPSA